MNVIVHQNHVLPHFDTESVVEAVREVVFFEGKHYDEVAIHFVCPSKICELHQNYFNDPSITDCISFPVDDTPDVEAKFRLMGDVFVCPQTALDYSQKHELAYIEEVTLYVIHGLLHLMRYDDLEETDEMKMREAESRHLQNLNKKSLILRECVTGANS